MSDLNNEAVEKLSPPLSDQILSRKSCFYVNSGPVSHHQNRFRALSARENYSPRNRSSFSTASTRL